MGYLGSTSFMSCIDSRTIFVLAKDNALSTMPYTPLSISSKIGKFIPEVKLLFLNRACIYFILVPSPHVWRYDSINGLCPTWSFELIVALHTDPRSVWCVKSIYLNLFASIGIWQRASCFHLMFFVLNTDKQACFCVLPSFGLCLLQPIFCSVDFERKEDYIVCMMPNHCIAW